MKGEMVVERVIRLENKELERAYNAYFAKINEVRQLLDRMENAFALVNRINLIVGSLGSFRRYFLHVGFPDN